MAEEAGGEEEDDDSSSGTPLLEAEGSVAIVLGLIEEVEKVSLEVRKLELLVNVVRISL